MHHFLNIIYLILAFICVDVNRCEAEDTLELVHVKTYKRWNIFIRRSKFGFLNPKVISRITKVYVFGMIHGFSSTPFQNGQYRMSQYKLFRHGDRTPDTKSVYPNDPYINYTYLPYGIGQLTNKGKLNMQLLGEALRKRYDTLLGPLYSPQILKASSTPINRTQYSLELVLGSLFPPIGGDVEIDNPKWIPYDTLSDEESRMFTLASQYCPKYMSELALLEQTPIGVNYRNQFAQLKDYVKKHSGWNEIVDWNLVQIYSALLTQEALGLTLPDWANQVYPEQLLNFAGSYFYFSTSTAELKKLSGGLLLAKIINDSLNVESKTQRMYLYSAHEINVVYLLSAMNVYEPHHPPFGAYVLIEVHTIKNVRCIKIFYQDYTKEEPKMLKVPGCDYICPISEFVELLKDNLGEDENQCSNDSNIIMWSCSVLTFILTIYFCILKFY